MEKRAGVVPQMGNINRQTDNTRANPPTEIQKREYSNLKVKFYSKRKWN